MTPTECAFSILNMDSVPEFSDLTRRARIRAAALELFAARGFEKTSIKSIAEASGVSPALVIHHYGSKSELRRQCDDDVITRILNNRVAAAEVPSPSLVQELLAAVDASRPEFAYVARMIIEPGEAGDELFARLVESTHRNLAEGREAGSITPASDPEVTALIVTVFGLSQFLLRERSSQVLGGDPLSTAGANRLTIPTLELLTDGLYADRSLLTAARAAMTQPDDSTQGTGPMSHDNQKTFTEHRNTR